MLKSRRTYLVWAFALIALVAVWGVSLDLIRQDRAEIAASSEKQAQQAMVYFGEYVESAFRYADSYTKAVRKEYVDNGQSLAAVERFMKLFPLDRKILSHITIINAAGIPIMNTAAPIIPGVNVTDRKYFARSRDSEADTVVVSMAQRGRNTGKSILRVVRRIELADGRFGGVVFAALDAEKMVDLVQSLNLGPNSSGTLVGEDKLIRARFTGGKFTFGQDLTNSPMWAGLAAGPSGHFSRISTVDGLERHFHFARISGFPLIGLISVAEKDIAKRREEIIKSHYLTLAVMTVLILAMTFFTLRQFAIREELEKATAALRANEAQTRLITDTLPAEINYTDRDGVIRFANLAYARRHGFKTGADVIGKNKKDIWGADQHADVRREIAATLSGKLTQDERRRVMPDGNIRTFLFTRAPQRNDAGEIIGYVTVGQDITDVKDMEAALAQSQKMESIGQLTGGVAHDFNNLLSVIMGNAELLSATAEKPAQELATILHATKRGAELTQRLLAFSRRQPLQPRALDVPSLIEGMADLIRRTIGGTITIQTKSEKNLPHVLVDPGQLENVLLNLAINSRDAMPRGGVLSIETHAVRLHDGTFDVLHEHTKPGTYVVLEVSDTGFGMTEEVRKRAVEPFFSTKDVGKGSGLGLSMAYGFARQSGGHLSIYSEPGIGTTVKLYLPVAEDGAAASKMPERAAEVPLSKGEKILLVEEDVEVLQMVKTMLRTLDYETITEPNARAALARLEAGEKIDLLLSDVVLPGSFTGTELAEAVSARWPDIRVLFISGYPAHAASNFAGARADFENRLLSKPFTRLALAQKLRSILDA